MRVYISAGGAYSKCRVRLAARILLLAVLVIAPAWTAVLAQELSDEASRAIAQGDAFFQHRDYEKAREAYRKADKLSHHTSAVCLLRVVRADRKLGDLSSAVDDAKKAAKVAGENKTSAAAAHFVLGTLLAQTASKPGDKKLKEAEQEFREALALEPQQAIVHYYLGVILMRQERDAEGIVEVKEYLAAPGGNPKILTKARRLVANPILSREPLAPDFSFETMEGTNLSNATLRGRVVLLDFWGTWCEACRESVPTLRDIRKKYGNRPFELIGVSSDNNEEVCRAFAAKNKMDWGEHVDLSGQVQEAFEIESFPTYIVLDKDGVIRFRQSGFSSMTGMELQEAIDKALKKAQDPRLASLASAQQADASPAEAAAEAGPAAQPGADPVESGTITGNLYRNPVLGFSYRFPEAWTAAKREALRAANAAAYAAMKAALARQGYDASGRVQFVGMTQVFYASRRGGGPGTKMEVPSVLISVVPAGMGELTLEAVEMNAHLVERTGLKLVGEIREFDAGEQHCFRADFADTAQSPQRWLSRITTAVEGYVVTIEFFAGNRQELEYVSATAKSLSFSNK